MRNDGAYWTIKDPDGHLIHTHVSDEPEDAIADFIKTEQTMNILYNAARATHGRPEECTKSWEVFEAEGYRVVPVYIVEAQP